MPTSPPPPPTDAILPRTSQEITDTIYDCLETVHNLFTAASITYSLLGAVRSGGMIPWDDDGDVVIHSKDALRLISLRASFAERGYDMRGFWHGIKLFRPGLPHFPDVDVFMVNDDYQYMLERTRLRWPGEPLPFRSLDRVRLVRFGHLMLFSVWGADARKLLDDSYGRDWATTVDKTHDHLYKQPCRYGRLVLVDFSHARHSSHPLVTLDSKDLRRLVMSMNGEICEAVKHTHRDAPKNAMMG